MSMAEQYTESAGIEGLFTCHTCGAAVPDRETHDIWHEALDAGAHTVQALVAAVYGRLL